MALTATATGIALVVGMKTLSAGAPRSALAAGAGTQRHTPAAGGSTSATASAHPGSGTTGSATSSPSSTAAATRSGRFTGSAVDTRYGTVQVAAVLAGGKLTDVVVLQETDGGRSHSIDSYALPVLRSEALTAQGANIDVVSGATYTSSGYAQSLQAALDQAGRG
jgi:uncharacterized protein with FMN-binding domain